MKSSEDIINFLNQKLDEKEKVDEKTGKIIDRLFIRLCGIFPAFKQAWPTQTEYNSAKFEWTEAFKSAKLDDVEKIKKGIERFAQLKNPFIPSPGQFIALCLGVNEEERCRVPEYKRLPEPERTEESKKIASNALAEMKRKLGLK